MTESLAQSTMTVQSQNSLHIPFRWKQCAWRNRNVLLLSEHNVQIGVCEYFFQDYRAKLVSDPTFVSLHLLVEFDLAATLYKCRGFFLFFVLVFSPTSLYELDLFKLNTLCNSDVHTIDNLYNQPIHSRYFSPHSFKEQSKYVIENDDDSFSIFHNNLISLSKNFENLQSSILDELGFNYHRNKRN